MISLTCLKQTMKRKRLQSVKKVVHCSFVLLQPGWHIVTHRWIRQQTEYKTWWLHTRVKSVIFYHSLVSSLIALQRLLLGAHVWALGRPARYWTRTTSSSGEERGNDKSNEWEVPREKGPLKKLLVKWKPWEETENIFQDLVLEKKPSWNKS